VHFVNKHKCFKYLKTKLPTMKVSPPKSGNNNGGDKHVPPLPLKAELPPEEDDLRLAKFKVRVSPTTATSPTYSFATRKLDGTEHLRYALVFERDCKKILAGLNVTTAAEAIPMIQELLTGIALAQFGTGIEDQIHESHLQLQTTTKANRLAAGDDEATATAAAAAIVRPLPDMDSVEAGYQGVILYMAPHKVLAKQKRWMRRNMRKPLDMSV
jgi:RecG-like helicase